MLARSDSSFRPEIAAIARLATPIALAQFGLQAIGLVDIAVLGHASVTDLGGASIGRSLNFTGLALGIGIAGAVDPLAAQAVGAKDHAAAWSALVASLVACVLVWIPCSITMVLATWLLEPLGIAPDLVRAARSFIVPQLPAMIAFAVFLCAKAFLQAHGKTRSPLVASLVANAVNIVVCNLLVRGDDALLAVGLPAVGMPALGAFGAGLASSIAHVVFALIVLAAAWRLRPRDLPIVSRLTIGNLPLRKVFAIGMPIGFQLLAEIGLFSLAGVLAGKLGRVPVSAHQIALGLSSFTFMGAMGIGSATAVRVGHAVGEGRPPRTAGLVGIGIGAGYMLLTAAVFLAFRRPLVALFTTDPDVITLGATLLVVAAAFQLFDGVQTVGAGALRGAGDVRFSFVSNVISHWLIGFPLAVGLGFYTRLGALGIWFGLLGGLVAISALLVYRFVVLSRETIARV